MVKSFAILFGVVFLLVGILGFVPTINNTADTCLHVVLAVVMLFLGFGAGPRHDSDRVVFRHKASAREFESLRCADDLSPWWN